MAGPKRKSTYRYKREHQGYRPGHEPIPTAMQTADRLLRRLKRVMKERVKAGAFAADVALEERMKNYDPVIEMAVQANDVNCPMPIRFAANAEVAKYVHRQLKSVDLELGAEAARTIVEIARYTGVMPALPMPRIEEIGREAEEGADRRNGVIEVESRPADEEATARGSAGVDSK